MMSASSWRASRRCRRTSAQGDDRYGAKRKTQRVQLQVPGIENIGGVGDLFTFLGESGGQMPQRKWLPERLAGCPAPS